MTGIMKTAALTVLLALAVAPNAGAQETDAMEGPHLPPDSMEIGRKYVDWFLNMQVDSLYAVMTPEMQERRSKEEIFEGMTQIFMRAGEAGDMVSEKYVMREGMPQYWYTGEFSEAPEPVQIRFVIMPDGRISGIGINLESQAPPIDD